MKTTVRVTLLALLVACGDSTGPATRTRPMLDSVSPATIRSGSGVVTLVVSGRGFVSESRILLDGAERATTAQGVGELRAQLEPSELAVSRSMTVTVANPEPDAAGSNALSVLVTNPVPEVGSVVPAQLNAGDPAITIAVVGRSFRLNSVVRWNGTDRPTHFVDDGRLDVNIGAADLASAARIRLSVHNPAPEGGASEREYVVYNKQPRILGLSPAQASAGDAATTLTVVGADFLPGAVVRWNGSPRSTTYRGSDRLTATIPASDLTNPSSAQVSVANPDPAIGVSTDSTFWVGPSGRHVIDLLARDLAWDPVRGHLYASVAHTDSRFPDEIVALDPGTGEVIARVSPGLGPGRLAISDDASTLYVTLDDEAAVARIDLASFTQGLRFSLGSGEFGTLYAEDIEVMPGAPGTVAVSRMNVAVSPHHEGVALYDNGVIRPTATARMQGGNLIEFSSPTTVYGYNNETTGFQLFRMDVTDTGLVVRDGREGLVEEFYTDIRYGGGYICSTGGVVIDATTGLLTARVGVQGLVFPEPDGTRIYYMTHTTLYAVSTATWSLIGAESPAGIPPAWYSFTRWGENGFAYIGPTQVMIFRSDLATR